MRAIVLGLVAAVFVASACNPPDPDLSSTDQLAVTLSTNSHAFGSVELGQTSAAYAFDVSPAGNSASLETITAITETCPDFSVNAPGLPADVFKTCGACALAPSDSIAPTPCCAAEYHKYTFTTEFAPTVAATVSCVVTVHLASGMTKSVTLTGTGTAPPIRLGVSPTSIAFGDVRRTTDSTAVAIDVSNTGGQTLTVSSISISPGFVISSGPTSGYALGGSATQPYSVVCHPTATGVLNGNFTINSNDPATPVKNIPLTCNGIDSVLSIAPSPATLPTTRLGEPVEMEILLVNSGTAPMSFEGLALSGTDLQLVSTPSTGTIAPNGSKNARVRFTAENAGMASGMLTITYDGGQLRTSAINARAVKTSMALTPDGDVDFGPICAGQSKTQPFTIVANDEGGFRVSALAAPAVPFTVTHPALPSNIDGSGGNMYTFDVAAAPTEAGQQMSSMTITTDIPGASPRTVNLSVDALPAGVTPTPTAIDFGSTVINTTTLGQRINVSSCGSASVTFSNARLEGVDAGEFAIVASPENTTVMGAGTVTWLVVMTTRSGGLKHAEFVVDYDGGTARIPLDGEGLTDHGGGGDDEPIGESSYYACSTGAAHGMVPIALVLGFVARRRRRARG